MLYCRKWEQASRHLLVIAISTLCLGWINFAFAAVVQSITFSGSITVGGVVSRGAASPPLPVPTNNPPSEGVLFSPGSPGTGPESLTFTTKDLGVVIEPGGMLSELVESPSP